MNATMERNDSDDRCRSGGSSPVLASEAEEIAAIAFATSFQWMAIAWSDDELQGIVFGHASRRQAEEALTRVHRLPRRQCRVVAE